MEFNQPPLPTEIDDDAYHKPSFNDLGLKESVLKEFYKNGLTDPRQIQKT
ncbi:ATP-dependent helicase, partial [Helicobacter pylori]|nr:ATP-dependent helicase [Helicobacter pylori]